ncbi:unnamed protein product [Lupinus luteus]|uniref:Uncharacterized protein n=1 Tax=Lupinus luteus TaxID=3873 RepID=A0AAV1YIM3_LUPLU
MQLRNLVWATSKHDVHPISHYSVMHWSLLTGNSSEIINFAGHVAPTQFIDVTHVRVILKPGFFFAIIRNLQELVMLVEN